MSDPVSALQGAAFSGFASIREIGPMGMITLRAKADAKGLHAAITACCGTDIPQIRQILHAGDRAAAWMSPDEYLLILPYDQTDDALRQIAQHMQGAHHLAATVSDARAMFRVEGAKCDEVVAKVAPIDLTAMQPGEIRRSRTAQVAAALWREGDGVTVVCFRSVGRYVFDLLASSARIGSELTG